MKVKIIIMLMSLAVLISACSQRDTTQASQSDNNQLVSKGLLLELKSPENTEAKTFVVRVFDKGLDPDTIVVNQGDEVIIEAWNTRKEIEKAERNTFFTFPFVNFEMHEQGNALIAKFVADKPGTYQFGNDRDPKHMGELIVN